MEHGGGIAMRVAIAGANGAIGRPLIGFLRKRGHGVFALARSLESARTVAALDAEPVVADALDATAVKAAITQVRPEAVINELTSLPRHYTAAEMATAADRDGQVRIEGNKNLLAALPEAGVRRYLLQSSGFWYAPGSGLADEDKPFAFAASPAIATGPRRYAELERTASAAAGIELVALRYGFLYGPGTWYDSACDVGEQVRRQQMPVIGGGQGVWSWVHIVDAAAATAAARERAGCIQPCRRRPRPAGALAARARERARRTTAAPDPGGAGARFSRPRHRVLRNPAARHRECQGKARAGLPPTAAGVAQGELMDVGLSGVRPRSRMR
jgi:2-alkyl-3-oxoalkanoate reductase